MGTPHTGIMGLGRSEPSRPSRVLNPAQSNIARMGAPWHGPARIGKRAAQPQRRSGAAASDAHREIVLGPRGDSGPRALRFATSGAHRPARAGPRGDSGPRALRFATSGAHRPARAGP